MKEEEIKMMSRKRRGDKEEKERGRQITKEETAKKTKRRKRGEKGKIKV